MSLVYKTGSITAYNVEGMTNKDHSMKCINYSKTLLTNQSTYKSWMYSY